MLQFYPNYECCSDLCFRGDHGNGSNSQIIKQASINIFLFCEFIDCFLFRDTQDPFKCTPMAM